MKRSQWLHLAAALLLLAAFVPGAQGANAQAPAPKAPIPGGIVPGEVLVAFPAGQSAGEYTGQAAALAGAVGGTVTSQYDNLALLSFDPQADVTALVEQVRAQAPGLSVQANTIYAIPSSVSFSAGTQTSGITARTGSGQSVQLSWSELLAMRTLKKIGTRTQAVATFPNDMPNNWGWNQVQTHLIWNNTSAGQLVCLLDTGVDGAHPDLSGKIVKGYDFVNLDSVPEDDNGHGTMMAGVIAAKTNNGKTTAAGVSNGKVLAVKVANAQGLGTSFTLAAGVLYCGKNSMVKVINISLGAYKNDPAVDLGIEYDALVQAIMPPDRDKFVVAAAGNDTTSKPMFPAAWADQSICRDGNTCAVGINPFSGGLIAVGAAAQPDLPFWVDTNGDLFIDDTEFFHNCAAYFPPPEGEAVKGGSNYGKWVEMVAPGESIYTTTPVSYNFWLGDARGVPAGYASGSGTSFAAAFVSGAVARMRGAFPRLTNASNPTIKTQLLDYSDPMDGSGPYDSLASNNGGASAIDDPAKGYNQNNSLFDLVQDDTYGDFVSAPFCWPVAEGEFQAEQDMSNAKYLNAAALLKRAGLLAEVRDATSAQPLKGATVQAVQVMEKISAPLLPPLKTLRASAVVGSDPLVYLINLPILPNTGYENVGYALQLSKTGYTNGVVVFNGNLEINSDAPSYLDVVEAGSALFSPYSRVGVPPLSNNIAVVANWQNVDLDADGVLDPANLDLALWLPTLAGSEPTTRRGVINQGALFYQPDGGQLYLNQAPKATPPATENLGLGTLLAPSAFGGMVSPYAQHMRESASDGVPLETVVIRGLAAGNPPYVSPQIGLGNYEVLLTDFSGQYATCDPDSYLGCQPDYLLAGDDAFTYPTVRVWIKGRVYRTVVLGNNTEVGGLCDDPNDDWWKPVIISGVSYTTGGTTANICGKYDKDVPANSILPYW